MESALLFVIQIKNSGAEGSWRLNISYYLNSLGAFAAFAGSCTATFTLISSTTSTPATLTLSLNAASSRGTIAFCLNRAATTGNRKSPKSLQEQKCSNQQNNSKIFHKYPPSQKRFCSNQHIKTS
jgi:hypothetical protein